MAATIKCDNSARNEIKIFLLEELSKRMEGINEDVDAVSVKETEDGLEVEYPIGEIYGYASDYVQGIPPVFDKIKKMYPNIEIYGFAYEYEEIQAYTFGPLFYCKSDDTELTVTYEWQQCAACGRIIETEAFYNSSQHDFKEGNNHCLCSPTCVLEYALSEGWGIVEPNDSFDEDEIDDIYDEEYEVEGGDFLKKVLWERVIADYKEYINDFSANKERITAMAEKTDLGEEKKNLLMTILDQMDQ